MKNLTFFLLVFASTIALAQTITGPELLKKSIQFHDPNSSWETFDGRFTVSLKMPNKPERQSNITISLPKEYFSLKTVKDSLVIESIINKLDCTLSINGSTDLSEALKKEHNLNCKRANLFKDYYTYLYGLPMKLNDEGTIIDPNVTQKTFKGKDYLVLKATYSKEVGKDTWYFYFNPKTYAMEVYQFFKDETKNDGEYILLTDLETINGIKMPKNRAWYYNKNDKYLATDILSKNASN
ncbi:DUF6503 family protein [Algibacter sp. TI.3.09]|uniref:DUF6503 family protein n=1 Tax=Algibacter sp. TI.3.09 TaxID=3121298 RepID=UPI00311E3971